MHDTICTALVCNLFVKGAASVRTVQVQGAVLVIHVQRSKGNEVRDLLESRHWLQIQSQWMQWWKTPRGSEVRHF